MFVTTYIASCSKLESCYENEKYGPHVVLESNSLNSATVVDVHLYNPWRNFQYDFVIGNTQLVLNSITGNAYYMRPDIEYCMLVNADNEYSLLNSRYIFTHRSASEFAINSFNYAYGIEFYNTICNLFSEPFYSKGCPAYILNLITGIVRDLTSRGHLSYHFDYWQNIFKERLELSLDVITNAICEERVFEKSKKLMENVFDLTK